MGLGRPAAAAEEADTPAEEVGDGRGEIGRGDGRAVGVGDARFGEEGPVGQAGDARDQLTSPRRMDAVEPEHVGPRPDQAVDRFRHPHRDKRRRLTRIGRSNDRRLRGEVLGQGLVDVVRLEQEPVDSRLGQRFGLGPGRPRGGRPDRAEEAIGVERASGASATARGIDRRHLGLRHGTGRREARSLAPKVLVSRASEPAAMSREWTSWTTSGWERFQRAGSSLARSRPRASSACPFRRRGARAGRPGHRGGG